jgi:acid stress-induced BolA-like protein IbaG/YrbA
MSSCSTNFSPSPESIRLDIERNLQCEHLHVEGDGQHFFATIVSQTFENQSRIRRHQTIYACLGERMKQEIHALSIKTFTPKEWIQQNHG